MQSKRVKSGVLSKDDKTYIRAVMDRHSIEQIAERLNRQPKQVTAYIDQVRNASPVAKTIEEPTLVNELIRRPEWKRFKEQFTVEELDVFKLEYVKLMAQFRDDLQPTEETQLFQLITIQILINRVLREQKQILDEIDDIDRLLLEARSATKPNKAHISELENKREVNRALLKSCGERQRNLMDKHASMLKDLKATRDQRVKVFENSRHSILNLLRALKEKDFSEAVGRETEIMRIATDKEYERLSLPHRYDDGVIDQPILTPENYRAPDESD